MYKNVFDCGISEQQQEWFYDYGKTLDYEDFSMLVAEATRIAKNETIMCMLEEHYAYNPDNIVTEFKKAAKKYRKSIESVLYYVIFCRNAY